MILRVKRRWSAGTEADYNPMDGIGPCIPDAFSPVVVTGGWIALGVGVVFMLVWLAALLLSARVESYTTQDVLHRISSGFVLVFAALPLVGGIALLILGRSTC